MDWTQGTEAQALMNLATRLQDGTGLTTATARTIAVRQARLLRSAFETRDPAQVRARLELIAASPALGRVTREHAAGLLDGYSPAPADSTNT
jgi:hypothetical protein